METRTKGDLLGERQVPADAYYGIHTLRAWENFQISGIAIAAWPTLINALAAVKEAAAQANTELGLLPQDLCTAIVAACRDVRAGELHDQFIIDTIQGGAGTSTNMNANEVICNRALEHLGRQRGEYRYLHPNEHVNLAQSTNDVYPTAIRIATCYAIDYLLDAMEVLRTAFERKAIEFADILKLGRTQLQDAVPMTLGQEFSTYAVMIEEDMARLREASLLIREINLGATAIGTGITAHPAYAGKALAALCRITGLELTTAPNLIEATQDCGAFVQISGVLKRIAVKLSKTCNDLRLLSSGPRAGLSEINLPPIAGRVFHHAGQGQSRHPGGSQPDRVRGVRQRYDDHFRGGGRAAPAQCVRTGHRVQPLPKLQPPDARLPDPGAQLRGRHYCESGKAARDDREVHRARDGTEPDHRIQERRVRRSRSACNRRDRARGGAGMGC